MSREKDVRDFTINRAIPDRINELHSFAADVSGRLPGTHRIRIEKFDATTGNPSAVVSEAAPVETGDYIRRAVEHVQRISPALGFTGQASEFVADPTVQETSSGARAVNLQQRYKGIPIFQAATTVRFAPNGSLTDTVGSSISVSQDTPVEPKLPV